MRYLIASLALMLSVGMAGTVLAAEDGEPSDEAVQAAVGETEEVAKEKGDGDKKGRRGKGGKGDAKGRRGGPGGHGPPKPEVIFDKFDKNKDGQLSREEFMELSKAMRERHAHRGPGKGPRGEKSGRGFGPRDGDRPGPPPRDGGRDFRRPEPLKNPGDRPGPPPEGRRGRGGEGDGPSARGRRGGPPEGHRMPDPNRIFERFDKNKDDQLSREEFKQLVDAMREMRERFGRHQGGGSDRDRPGPPRGRGREGSDRSGPPRGERGGGANFESPVEDDGTA